MQPHSKLGWNLIQLITVSAGLCSSQISSLIRFTMQLQTLLHCKDGSQNCLNRLKLRCCSRRATTAWEAGTGINQARMVPRAVAGEEGISAAKEELVTH